MEIQSTRFGTQEVEPSNTLYFPNGFAGFEQNHRFQLLNEEIDNPALYYLQSLDDPDVTLHTAVPSQFGIDYEIDLSDDDMALLESRNGSEIIILCIVSKKKGGEAGVTPHAECPVLINTVSKRGLQMKTGQINVDPQFSALSEMRIASGEN
mgnify:CR=1 FL=1